MRQLFAAENTRGLVMLIRSELKPVEQCCRRFHFQAVRAQICCGQVSTNKPTCANGCYFQVPRTLVGAVEKYAIPRGIMVCTIEWEGEVRQRDRKSTRLNSSH